MLAKDTIYTEMAFMLMERNIPLPLTLHVKLCVLQWYAGQGHHLYRDGFHADGA